MSVQDQLASRFEADRTQLRQLAYRMLGSLAEAEDAVQETWLRLTRTDATGVQNLAGWLRTVLSRICLDMLRSRAARREDLVGTDLPGDMPGPALDPEAEAVLLDEVGRALVVVLGRLDPAERVAFVLHDMFAVPFSEIAPILDRTPVATKKLASRARIRMRGMPLTSTETLNRHRRVVEAFLAATQAGDLDAILAVLAPDVTRRAEPSALIAGRPVVIHGADAVAKEMLFLGQSARFAAPALIDGAIGLLVAPAGRLQLAITLTIKDDQIATYELITSPERLRRLDLAVLDH